MLYGLEEGATSSGPTPLRYGDVEEYAGGPRICHLGVVKTVATLAPTHMPRDGVDAGSNGEISSWNIRSSAPVVVSTRTRSVVALLFRGVCGPFRDPKDDRVCGSPAAAAQRGWGWPSESLD
jgi:hypothetical protein